MVNGFVLPTLGSLHPSASLQTLDGMSFLVRLRDLTDSLVDPHSTYRPNVKVVYSNDWTATTPRPTISGH
jgi:hypothetical protein